MPMRQEPHAAVEVAAAGEIEHTARPFTDWHYNNIKAAVGQIGPQLRDTHVFSEKKREENGKDMAVTPILGVGLPTPPPQTSTHC